ncbi:hypothetical protein ACFSO9_10640 [Mesonia maritima]|uniref:hypothetical protein n=1 Tax=Mesonia maritima TaxID=1793873 RepID=UPI00363D27F8
MKYSIFLVCGFMMMLSCKEKETTEVKEKSYQEQNAEALSQIITIDKDRKITLLPAAKEATNNWSAYLTLKNEIENFDNVTFQEVINNSNNLVESVVNLKASIPGNFDVKPVRVRINVLLTKAEVLRQKVENPRIKTKTIDTLVNDLHKAFGDLKIQLNEVYIETLEEIESEFEQAIQVDSTENPSNSTSENSTKTPVSTQ